MTEMMVLNLIMYCILLCLMCTHVLAQPMYNAHIYFSLKNLGKKSVHFTWQNMVGTEEDEGMRKGKNSKKPMEPNG